MYTWTSHETFSYFHEDVMIEIFWEEDGEVLDTELFPCELAECAYESEMEGAWTGLLKVRILNV